MKILDLITSPEELEPETLHTLFPDLGELECMTIFVYKLLLQSNIIYEDMDVFENAVYILNEIEPDPSYTQGVTTEMIWKAISKIKKIRTDFDFSHEVLMYIKYISNSEGIYFYPENIGLENKHLQTIKQILETGKRLEETFFDIQAYKYLKLMEQTK